MPQPLPRMYCQRCGHNWVPRKGRPHTCPKCKSPKWDSPGPQEVNPQTQRERPTGA